MIAFKLFISHSSRLDEESEDSNNPDKNPNLKLLLDVIQEIKQEYGNTIEVLVDKDKQAIPAGQDWEKSLNEWLAECHAAIILFSKRALENSNWVKKEAAILSWRKEIDPDFMLIPICIKGQSTPEDLETDIFATLHIAKNQAIRHAEDSSQIIAEIKQALGNKNDLEKSLKLTPFDELETVIGELLIRNTSNKTLESIWSKLKGHDKPKWHPNTEIKFASALTRYLLRDSINCFSLFQNIIDKIHPKVQEKDAREVLEYIRSLWVDVKAAGCIPIAKNHKKYMAMNGKFAASYTFKRYSERAYPLTNLYTLVPTTQSDEIKLIEEIRAKFQKYEQLTAKECDDKINDYDRQVLVLLPAENQNGGGLLGDQRTRINLRKKYPNAIFILGTGEKLPAAIASDICLVEPELDLELEKNSKKAEITVREFLDDYYEQ